MKVIFIEWKYFFIKRKYILSKFATLQQPYKPTANCFFLRQTRLLYPAVLAKYASHMTYQEVFSSLSQSSLRAGSLVWVGNCGQRRQRQARTGEAGEKNKARKVTFFPRPILLASFCRWCPIQTSEPACILDNPAKSPRNAWKSAKFPAEVSSKNLFPSQLNFFCRTDVLRNTSDTNLQNAL